MKQIASALLIVITLLALAAFTPAPARADGPTPDIQPWMYAAVEYTGLGNVAAVQAAFKNYQDGQAALHQYTTPAMWQGNYESDVTNFLHQHGCASCSISDNVLSYKLKIDVPVMFHAFNRFDAQGF